MAADQIYDLMIIGGGINGAGIARDAAGRGYSVYLAEMSDLASGTSSAATKLIHGGLRYLEHYAFRLVREALSERERLWEMAPHIIRPMRFVLPYQPGQRPKWMLRSGLFLYDSLGGRKRLAGTRTLDLSADPAGAPLRPGFSTGYEYSDCWVDDARLVVLNARDAADRGAVIRTRTRVTGAEIAEGGWRVTMTGEDGAPRMVRAKMVVNAAGPWADSVFDMLDGRKGHHAVRLVQGSHIVVRRLFDHDRSYFFQNADGRIVFAIPYEDDYTLIGTTDLDFSGDPGESRITEGEIDYLLAAAADYFTAPPQRADIVWTYSGVRPLYDDGAGRAQDATRDYVLKLDAAGGAPLLNVFGGKLTTYRRLAEEALERIGSAIGPKGKAWTGASRLPGGDFGVMEGPNLVARLGRDLPFLPRAQAARLVRNYGTLVPGVLGHPHTPDDLGRHFGAGLFEREVLYLVDKEWARTAEDIVWRRTKLGLRMSGAEIAALEDFLGAAR